MANKKEKRVRTGKGWDAVENFGNEQAKGINIAMLLRTTRGEEICVGVNHREDLLKEKSVFLCFLSSLTPQSTQSSSFCAYASIP